MSLQQWMLLLVVFSTWPQNFSIADSSSYIFHCSELCNDATNCCTPTWWESGAQFVFFSWETVFHSPSLLSLSQFLGFFVSRWQTLSLTREKTVKMDFLLRSFDVLYSLACGHDADDDDRKFACSHSFPSLTFLILFQDSSSSPRSFVFDNLFTETFEIFSVLTSVIVLSGTLTTLLFASSIILLSISYTISFLPNNFRARL